MISSFEENSTQSWWQSADRRRPERRAISYSPRDRQELLQTTRWLVFVDSTVVLSVYRQRGGLSLGSRQAIETCQAAMKFPPTSSTPMDWLARLSRWAAGRHTTASHPPTPWDADNGSLSQIHRSVILTKMIAMHWRDTEESAQ